MRRRRVVAPAAAVPLAALALASCGPRAAPAPDAAEAEARTTPAAQAGDDRTPGPSFDALFEDATEGSGLSFVHHEGAFGEKLLPETLGAGACLFDADGDGHLDVFLVDGTAWPERVETDPRGACALFRGRGDGTFEDVSAASGADVEVFGMGCAAADYDGDGDEDLYVTTLGDDLLLRNDGGRFHDVAERAGVGRGRWTDRGGAPRPEWTTAAAWFDADGDADLDLFVGGYCRWTPELEIFTTLDGVDKAFTTPDHYTGLAPRLYLNRGDGGFEERPFVEGEPPTGKTLGVVVHDLDDDGWLDVLVANDTRPNFFFRSLGEGRFVEEAVRAGLAYDGNGRARAGMGIDVGTLPRWGTSVVIGNFAGEPLSLYRRDGEGHFQPTAARAGLARATHAPLAFGLALVDLDLDGWLDLVVANGHIEPDIDRFRPGERHAQPAQVFQGRADGTFVDATAQAGEDLARPRVGRGLAIGDVDEDGDLDLLITQNGGPAALLLNRLQERTPRHYLRVDLVGPPANRRAIGARVTLQAGGRERVATVHAGSSYLSQSETTLTFGLGDLGAVDGVTVRWPGGRSIDYAVPAVDRTVVLREEP